MENEKSTTQANLPEARRGVSRRGFLSGAALAAGAAAVAGLALSLIHI